MEAYVVEYDVLPISKTDFIAVSRFMAGRSKPVPKRKRLSSGAMVRLQFLLCLPCRLRWKRSIYEFVTGTYT